MSQVITGINPKTGEDQHLKVFSGDPSDEADGAVLQRADPITHGHLLSVVGGLQAQALQLGEILAELTQQTIALSTALSGQTTALSTALSGQTTALSTALSGQTTALSANVSLVFGKFSGAASAAQVIKAAPGRLYSFFATAPDAGLTTNYLLLFDRNSVPAANATDFRFIAFPLDSGIRLALGTEFFGPDGYAFSSGITCAISSSPTAYVAVASPSEFRLTFGYI